MTHSLHVRRSHVKTADRLARRASGAAIPSAATTEPTESKATPAVAAVAAQTDSTQGAPTADAIASHREAMLRFARRKVRDEALAEDAVQDALAAALAVSHSFQGQSSLRTWLIGILNHKIQDGFRREGRYVLVGGYEENGADPFDWLAAEPGEDRDEPSRRVERARLGEALYGEIEALPDTLKDVFVMQALEGEETAEVCRRLDITEANCWVRLHRARKRLSQRLADHLS